MNQANSPRKRLAIIGAGCSGLITLKSALDVLPNWEIVCFEKSGRTTGVWGNPYPGFVSTSTKYTTQFACFMQYDATMDIDGAVTKSEFFRDGEYLERFADAFHLRPHIRLHHTVRNIQRSESGTGWQLTVSQSDTPDSPEVIETFDQVIVCTGLAARPKPINSQIPCLTLADLHGPGGLSHIHNRRIVVMGGGESAVDYACRLARPELQNKVFLSLRTGIRVSPRYHPIRGVPSDFLRNRLMLSVHEDLRNRIGQRFVECRIKYQEMFERFFPAQRNKQDLHSTSTDSSAEPPQRAAVRKDWSYRLTKGAKDSLFNMFHNKSEEFLDLVGDGQITIVGPPADDTYQQYRGFDTDELLDLSPDTIVPAIGYGPTLEGLFDGAVRFADFHLGCTHITYPDLYAVGFARPIIGNIPTISEIQARYICGMIAGHIPRTENIAAEHLANRAERSRRFPQLDLERAYPEEMFVYCDDLSRRMNTYPSLSAAGSLRTWLQVQLAPATTLHYLPHTESLQQQWRAAPIYMPWTLILLLLMLKPVDAVYRTWRYLFRRKAA
ncbi:MAG: hypothetical protein SGJ20_11175 [Planctomycetota bacterium]|nr:hypothetical protein [Planctomycetota bacterium]